MTSQLVRRTGLFLTSLTSLLVSASAAAGIVDGDYIVAPPFYIQQHTALVAESGTRVFISVPTYTQRNVAIPKGAKLTIQVDSGQATLAVPGILAHARDVYSFEVNARVIDNPDMTFTVEFFNPHISFSSDGIPSLAGTYLEWNRRLWPARVADAYALVGVFSGTRSDGELTIESVEYDQYRFEYLIRSQGPVSIVVSSRRGESFVPVVDEIGRSLQGRAELYFMPGPWIRTCTRDVDVVIRPVAHDKMAITFPMPFYNDLQSPQEWCDLAQPVTVKLKQAAVE